MNMEFETLQGLRNVGREQVIQGPGEAGALEAVRDLRFLLTNRELRELVAGEVARLDWQNPDLVGYLTHYPEYRPQVLLSVLVLAYAIQEFESEGISAACEQDCEFRTLCAGRAVSAQDLIKFRRANRPLIEVVLARVLQEAVVRVKVRRFGGVGSAGEEYYFAEARRCLDIARHFDTLD